MTVLFSFLANSAFAATIQVPANQPTINAALAAANNGDTILVANGTYVGPFVINKSVVLTSEFINSNNQLDIQNTILSLGGIGSVVTINAAAGAGHSLIGFRILGGATGITSAAPATIRNNQIINNTIGIDYLNNAGGNCDDNIFLLNATCGLRVADANGLQIDNNVFQQNGDAIRWLGDGSGTISNNDIVSQFGAGILVSGLPQLTIETNDINTNVSDGIIVQFSNLTVPGTPDLIISDNEIYSNGQDGIKIIDNLGPGAADIRLWIERNILSDNTAAGIGCLLNGNTNENFEAASLNEELIVLNNTFADNDYGMCGGDNALLVNNIFQNNGSTAIKQIDGNSTVAYTLFFGNGLDNDNSNLELSSTLIGNPLLSAAYLPSPLSPAVDVGLATIVWNGNTLVFDQYTDFNGKGRDIGAKETAATFTPNVAVQNLPANLATNEPLNPTFQWTGDLPNYEIEIYRSPSGTPPQANMRLDQYTLKAGPITVGGVPNNLSGATFNPITATFFTVNNGSELIYEHDSTSLLLRTITLTGFDDIEAIVHISGDQYAITEERRRHIALVSINAATTNINYAAASILQLPQAATDNQGLEGVAYDPIHEMLFTLKESGTLAIYQMPHPNTVSYADLSDYAFDLGTSTMLDVSGLHHLGISDGVVNLGVQDHMLILSDLSARLEERDGQGNLISSLDLGNGGANGTLATQLAQAEGVTVDEHGEILVMSEPNTWYRFAHPTWNTLLGDCELAYRATDLTATTHTIPANTLVYNTQYVWRIRGHRLEEWSDWSAWRTFTTEPNPDNIAPTQPINLVSPAQTATSVDLAWTASTDNVGVVGYYIYVDGVLYDSVASTNATVYGLAFNTFYTFQVAAYDAAGNISIQSPALVASTLPNLSPPVTIVLQIATSDDDAEEYISNGVMDLNSTDLELGQETGDLQYVGLRFPNVPLPIGSVIINAYVEFTVDETTTAATNVNIWAHDIGNAPTFTLVNSNISNRAPTNATQAWGIPIWNVVGQAGPNQQTPNLNTVLQEVVSRNDWSTGQALAIIFEGLSNRRTAEAYDGVPTSAARLVIEYAEGAGPVLAFSEAGLEIETNDCQNQLLANIQKASQWTEAWIEKADDPSDFSYWQSLELDKAQATTLDNHPSPLAYYRIATRDLTGQLHYSKVSMAENVCQTWGVFPNPSSGEEVYVQIAIVERSSPLIIEVFDLIGRSVLRQEAQATEGLNQIPVRLPSLAKGTYWISLSGPNGQLGRKALIIE
ncbi:MAG: SdiA-regulated domain-containing protein [Bacteroidia bacterium]